MAKKSPASESAHSAVYTVFIDTNLDTHLAMIVSADDTVCNLKKKIMIEHPRCFPNAGEITIHALKIKRKGFFYHLSDSMLVKSAFDGVTKSWFLQVDASSHQVGPKENLSHLEPGASDLPASVFIMDGSLAERNIPLPDHPSKVVSILDDSSLPQVGSSQVVYQIVPPDQFSPGNTGKELSKDLNWQVKVLCEEHCKSFSDTNKGSDSEVLKKYNLVSRGNEDPGTRTECMTDKSKKRTRNMQYDSKSGETLQSEPVAKKRHKSGKKNDAFYYPMEDPLKENNVRICIASKETSQPEDTFQQSFSNENNKLKTADSDGFSTRPPQDDQLLETSLGNKKTKKKTRKKSSNLYDQVDSTVSSSGKNVRQENSKETLGNTHRDLNEESGAAIAREHTIQTATLSNPSAASGVRKTKKLKKHRAASVKGFNLLVVNGPDNLTKDSTTLVYDNFGPEQTIRTATLSNPSAIYEKEGDCCPVGEGNQSPCSSLGRSHGALALKAAPVDVADSLVGIDMGEHGASKVESRRDASDHIAASGVRKTKKLKKHRAASVKGLDLCVVAGPDDLTKDGTTLVYDNFGPGVKFGADEAGKTKRDEKALPQNDDPKTMVSEAPNSKFESFDHDEKGVNFKGVIVSSDLLDASGILGTGNPGDKRRKKSKKYRDSDSKGHISSSGVEQGNVAIVAIPLKSKPENASIGDHPGDETKKEDSIFSQIEKAEVSEVKNVNAPLTGLDKETDIASGNGVNSVPLAQSSKIQETAGYCDNEVKKKSKKNRTSAKNFSDPPMKEQDVSTGDPASTTDEQKEKNAPSKKTKESRFGITGPVNQLTESISEAEKGSGNKIESSQTRLIPGTNESSRILLDMFECNTEGRPHEADIKNDNLVNECKDKANNHIEAPKFKSDKINFIDYFVPSQGQHELAPAKELDGKEIKIKRSEKELSANKKIKKLNVNTGGASPDLQSSLNSNDGHKAKPQGDTSDTIQVQGSLSKNEQSELMAHPNGKNSVITGDMVKAPSHHHDEFDAILNEASRTKTVRTSGTNGPVYAPVVRGPSRASTNTFMKENSADQAASSSSSESSDGDNQNKKRRELQSHSNHYRVAIRKASSKRMGEVSNSSNHEKSLLATSGAIFKDCSSESSEDEGEINNSQASTRSPSESSSSSDYSEGKNQANLDSPQNVTGSYSAKGKESGGNKLTKPQSVDPNNVSFDTILRSSSRYKKAKLTASQSQLEDTESQPIDFVLDSLAD